MAILSVIQSKIVPSKQTKYYRTIPVIDEDQDLPSECEPRAFTGYLIHCMFCDMGIRRQSYPLQDCGS